MDAADKLYPGWNDAVQEVMDEGVGMLDIPVRTANSLEEEAVLTVYDLLLKSLHEWGEIASVGDKSFNAIKLALRRKGFRRVKGRRYDPDEPLYLMYEGCFPERDDPTDLVTATSAVDDDSPMLLTHKQALERAVTELKDIRTHYGKTSKQGKMLDWVIYHAETREPEEEDSGEETKK
jgi:hypothetical protein